MSDQAGPSGENTRLTDEQLAEIQAKFDEGVSSIKANDIDKAVQLFADVLKSRVQHYGEMAPECASAYYRYGSALLYQAQDSADVFGGPIQEQAEENKENGLLQSGGEPAAAPAAGDETQAGSSKDATAEDETDAAQEEGEQSGAGVEGDLQLAWENLETARAIWAKDSDSNTEQLASVHMLLGDVNMENGAFEEALADYEAAVKYQTAASVSPDDRRIAEIQFKRCCAAQFLGRIEDAMSAVDSAIEVLKLHKSNLAADAAELDNIKAVLEELEEKKEELETVAQEQEATRATMRGAMAQLTAAMTAKTAGQQAGGSADASEAQPASIKDLGTVGRGTKRINLASVPQSDKPSKSADPAQPAPKKKRSLEDLMGPSVAGADTAVGFGNQGGEAEEKKEEALPAFLQAYKKD